jgi:Cellulase (glycosyl hydrolase family 5)
MDFELAAAHDQLAYGARAAGNNGLGDAIPMYAFGDNSIGAARRHRPANSLAKVLQSLLVVSMLAALAACDDDTQVNSSGSPSTSGTTTPASTGTVAPVVTLSPNAGTVVSGHSVILNWSAKNAQSCMASGGWSGSEATSGSQATAALTATTQFTLTCTGAGGSASRSAAVSVSAALPSISLSASPASVANGDSSMLTWAATNATACSTSGGWSGSVATSGSKTTGEITATTIYTLSCTGSGGTASQSTTVAVTSGAPTGGTVSRPSYNTGNGFFVLNGKLYDPNGNEFRIRGVDRLHYDSKSAAGIAKSGANTVRFALYLTSVGASTYANELQTQHIANKQVVIPTMFYFPNNTVVSGNQSTTELAAGVAWWVANASVFTALNKYMIVNIANEWGPQNSTVWRDSYISAIASLRAAGYLGPLMIDSGAYGQDPADLLTYASAVFNSDPQKNIIFSFHVYGGYTTLTTLAGLNALSAQLAALSATDGMVFVFGEFGPGRNIGPSPTLITPGQVITAAETNGIGWVGWAWDDNDLADGQSDNNWFSMTYSGPGIYTQTSDLTTYGQDVVLNPTYGLQVLAKPATIF